MRLIGFWISAFVLYIGFAWILVDSAAARLGRTCSRGPCVVESD